MLLDFLGGMARQGTKILDEKREIQNKIDLTEKLTEIELKAKQRAAANARAAKRKENTMNAMEMLLPLTGGDEALAQQIYTEYGEGVGDLVAKGRVYQSMGIPFLTGGDGPKGVNPALIQPDISESKSVYETILLNSNDDEQKSVASMQLEKIRMMENAGENSNLSTTAWQGAFNAMDNALTQAMKKDAVAFDLTSRLDASTGRLVYEPNAKWREWMRIKGVDVFNERSRLMQLTPENDVELRNLFLPMFASPTSKGWSAVEETD